MATSSFSQQAVMSQTTIASEKKEKMLVAAIDFGTTYCGYAFSFKHDYQNDPTKVSTNQNWVAGSMQLVSLKAPSVVLFDEKKNFHSFGYEAENVYSELALDNEHHKWYFFKRFKMILHGAKVLNKGMQLNWLQWSIVFIYGKFISFNIVVAMCGPRYDWYMYMAYIC